MGKPKNYETRRKILANAYHLFLDKGFEDVSMKELASTSGIDVPLLQHYYSK